MIIYAILLLIPSSVLGAFGSLFLKKGSKKFSISKLHQSKEIVLGLFLFVLSSFFYIIALRFGNLSIIYPLSSFTYILIAFLSIKFLGEKMNYYKWLGIIFIILGAFLIVN